MNKLRLFLSIVICGVVFSGCSFFDDFFVKPFSDEIKYIQDIPNDACIPDDMMKRLAKKSYYEGYYQNKKFKYDWEKEFVYVTNDYGKIFSDDRYKDTGTHKCYDLVTQSYNEAIKNATKLPTNIKEELEFAEEWLVCDNMPKWLESKLFEYINQNKGNDLAYINASNFKVSWSKQLTGDYKYVWGSLLTNDRGRMANCVAKKAAIKAIENDLIDLGNGKKAKCADLSYNDAPKCLAYFEAVYDKTYKAKKKELDAEEDALEIKRVRLKHEKQNRQ